MKTIALHTTEYHRAHSSDEGMWRTALSVKLGKLLNQMITGAVIILMVTVISVACIKVGKSGITSANYCDAITKVIFVP